MTSVAVRTSSCVRVVMFICLGGQRWRKLVDRGVGSGRIGDMEMLFGIDELLIPREGGGHWDCRHCNRLAEKIRKVRWKTGEESHTPVRLAAI